MDVVTYQCPNCGSALAFDIASNSWKCASCGTELTLEQLDGLQKTQEKLSEPSEVYGQDAVVYNCPSCGGRIITDANTTATFCAYCHNPTVIASRIADEYLPEQVLPFRVTKQKALATLAELCRRSPLTPKDFHQYAQSGEITGLYVPFFLFDCSVSASLSGEADKISRWSDSDYDYTKTDTFRVERDAAMQVINMPVDGSLKMDDTLMQSLEPFDYQQMVDFNMQYLAGYYADNFDLDTEQALSSFMSRLDQQVQSLMRELVSGYSNHRIDYIRMQQQDLHRRYVLLPVWLLMAKYGGETYTFAMNGQSGKTVGRLPRDNNKLLLWTSLVFLIVFLIVAFMGVQ